MTNIKNVAREIAGPDARIKRHGLFKPVYSVTTEPSILDNVYKTASEYALPTAVSAAMLFGPLSKGANTAIAEEMEKQANTAVPKTILFDGLGGFGEHFPFPEKLGTKLEIEHQPETGGSHFGLTMAEIGEDGKPIYGDWLRVYRDLLADGTAETNAGVRVPFDFGYKGNLALYGMEHVDDDGMGARLSGSYGDWLLKGVVERLETSGNEQELTGIGIGKMIDSGLGKTEAELWVYGKNGKNFGNLFLFQNFKDGYLGGVSITAGDKSEKDISASFGRFREHESWRFHGDTGLDGERFSVGGSYITDPDPRFAVTPYGYLSTESGVKSTQKLWTHAMDYYPYQRIFEAGKFVFRADYRHDRDFDNIMTQASIRPFQIAGSKSGLLRGIHIDGKYDWKRLDSGHDNRFTLGLGIDYKDMDFFIVKAEGEGPVLGAYFRKSF